MSLASIQPTGGIGSSSLPGAGFPLPILLPPSLFLPLLCAFASGIAFSSRSDLFFPPQRVGDRGPAGRGPLCPADLSADAGAEAGPLHAGPPAPARRPHEDHGQCGHLLHVADALHLHI